MTATPPVFLSKGMRHWWGLPPKCLGDIELLGDSLLFEVSWGVLSSAINISPMPTSHQVSMIVTLEVETSATSPKPEGAMYISSTPLLRGSPTVDCEDSFQYLY
jgi:hypothetical protein